VTNFSTNNIQVQFGPDSVVECNQIISSQNINVDQNVTALSQYQSTTNIANLMKQSIDATMSQSQKAVSDFLSTTFGNQESNTNIQNTLNQLIDNNVTDDNTQNITSMLSSLNSGIFVFNGKIRCTGPDGQINLSQGIIVDQFVKSVTGLMTTILLKNTQIAKAVNKSTQDQSVKNTGIGDAISKVLSSLGLFILLPLAIIIVIFVLLGGMKKLSGIGKGKGSIMNEAKMMKFYRGY
jgi:hypothetical protein